MLVAFDLDDTLLDHAAALHAAALALHERIRPAHVPDAAEFAARWARVSAEAMNAHLRGALTFSEQRRVRVRALFDVGIGPSTSDREADTIFSAYLEYYSAHWRPFPDVFDCLDRLGRRHPLAVITNGDREQQARKLKAIGLADRFVRMLTPSDVGGAAKPSPAIFTAARAGFEGPAVYVGDQLGADVEAANAAGWRGVWLNRRRAPRPAGPVLEVASLTALPDLLASL